MMEIEVALCQFLDAINVVHKEDWGGEVVSSASHTCSTRAWLRTHPKRTPLTFVTTRNTASTCSSTFFEYTSASLASALPVTISSLLGTTWFFVKSTGRSPTMMPRWCWRMWPNLGFNQILLHNHNPHDWGGYELRIGGGGRCCGWFVGAGVMSILRCSCWCLSSRNNAECWGFSRVR